MRSERAGNTLQTTALVNEVYLRMVDVKNVNWQQRAQFFAISAQMMRRILVDAARARSSAGPQRLTSNLHRMGERILFSGAALSIR
jgi:hypothetical protein